MDKSIIFLILVLVAAGVIITISFDDMTKTPAKVLGLIDDSKGAKDMYELTLSGQGELVLASTKTSARFSIKDYSFSPLKLVSYKWQGANEIIITVHHVVSNDEAEINFKIGN